MPIKPGTLKLIKAPKRLSSHRKGYTARWLKVAKQWLRDHPLCVHCEREGRVRAATQVDHIKAHRGDMDLFWDDTNWQSLCRSCHSKKTVREDGGFGNAYR